MNQRHLVAAVVVLGMVAFVAAWLRAPDQRASSETTSPPPPPIDEGDDKIFPEERPPPPPSLTRPPAPLAGVPILSDGRIERVRLNATPLPEAVIIPRVEGQPETAETRHWEDLLQVAGYIALESMEEPEPGLSITIRPGSARPESGQLAALTVAIRLQLAGRPEASQLLIEGMVTPDGSIQPLGDPDRSARLAAHRKLELPAGNTLERILISHDASQRRAPIQPKTLESDLVDLRAQDTQAIQEGLRRVVGSVMRRRPATLPLPTNWRERTAHLEARIRRTQPATLNELIDLAVIAAELRGAVRGVRFAHPRIQNFPQHGEALEGSTLRWLTLLVVTHVDARRATKEWLRALSPAREQPRMIRIPSDWLVKRAELLRMASRAMTRLTRRRLRGDRSMSKPWPLSDPRSLAWRGTGPKATRVPAADWGDQLVHLALAWSQLCAVEVLGPQHNTQVADPNALTVRDPARLDSMLSVAAERSLIDLARLPDPPREVTRLIISASAREKQKRKVAALEWWWTADLVARASHRLAVRLRRRANTK